VRPSARGFAPRSRSPSQPEPHNCHTGKETRERRDHWRLPHCLPGGAGAPCESTLPPEVSQLHTSKGRIHLTKDRNEQSTNPCPARLAHRDSARIKTYRAAGVITTSVATCGVPNEAPLEREQRSRCKKVALVGVQARDPQSPFRVRFFCVPGALPLPWRRYAPSSFRAQRGSLRVFSSRRSARRGICFCFVAPGFSPAPVPRAGTAPLDFRGAVSLILGLTRPKLSSREPATAFRRRAISLRIRAAGCVLGSDVLAWESIQFRPYIWIRTRPTTFGQPA
jgi:hypothetical protein